MRKCSCSDHVVSTDVNECTHRSVMVQLARDAVPEASPQTQNVGKRSRHLQRSSCFCHTINTSVTHASSGSAQTLTKKRDQRRLRPCSWYCVYRRHGKITNCALVGLSRCNRAKDRSKRHQCTEMFWFRQFRLQAVDHHSKVCWAHSTISSKIGAGGDIRHGLRSRKFVEFA